MELYFSPFLSDSLIPQYRERAQPITNLNPSVLKWEGGNALSKNTQKRTSEVIFFSLPYGSLKEAHSMIQGHFSKRVLWISFLFCFVLEIDYNVYGNSQLAKIFNWQLLPGHLSYAQNCAGQSQGYRKSIFRERDVINILRTVGEQSGKLWHRLRVWFFTLGVQQRENPIVIKQTGEGGT